MSDCWCSKPIRQYVTALDDGRLRFERHYHGGRIVVDVSEARGAQQAGTGAARTPDPGPGNG